MGALVHLSALLLATTVFEGGLQVGVADRMLGNTPFRPSVNAQLYGDVMVMPRLLAVGAYWNGEPTGNRAPPDRLSAGDVAITALGVRAKLFWPREGARPYASVGIGRVTAEFPETRREDRVAVASVQRFAEIPMTLGVMVPLEGPFVMTGEGTYRLGLGYRNDAYDSLLHGGSSARAYTWTLHFGLAVTL